MHIYVLLIPKCEWYVKYSWIDLCYNDKYGKAIILLVTNISETNDYR